MFYTTIVLFKTLEFSAFQKTLKNSDLNPATRLHAVLSIRKDAFVFQGPLNQFCNKTFKVPNFMAFL